VTRQVSRPLAALLRTLLAALALAGAGCGGEKPMAVSRVRARVDVVTFGGAVGHGRAMPRRRAEWVARKALGASEVLGRIEVDSPGWIVEVQGLLELDSGRGRGRGTATVAIESSRFEGPVQAVRSFEGTIAGTADRGPFEKALGRAVDAAAGLESLRRLPPAGLRDALSTEDPERLVVAARALGSHHRPEDVPAVVGLLRHTSPAVREAATGALVVLGDPSAVRALIDTDDTHDPLSTIRILDAVAALGGDEATAWVEFVATGHPLETVRRTAHQARRRMARSERRAAGKAR